MKFDAELVEFLDDRVVSARTSAVLCSGDEAAR